MISFSEGAPSFEHALLVQGPEVAVVGDGVGQLERVVQALDREGQVLGDLVRELGVTLELVLHRAAQGHEGLAVVLLIGERIDHPLQILALGIIMENAPGLAAFDQDFGRAVGQAQDLDHLGKGADLVKIIGPRVFALDIALGDEKNLLIVSQGGLKRQQGFMPNDEQRGDAVGKDNDLLERDDRQHFGF